MKLNIKWSVHCSHPYPALYSENAICANAANREPTRPPKYASWKYHKDHHHLQKGKICLSQNEVLDQKKKSD